MGFEGRTASSTVPEEAVPRIRAAGGKVKPGSKPRAATAEQLPTRRQVRAKEQARRESGNGEVTKTATAVEAPPEPPALGPETVVVPEEAPPAAVPALRVPRGATAQDLAQKLGSST